MKKLIVTMLVVLAIAGGVTGLVIANNDEPKQAQQSTKATQADNASSPEVSYAGVTGKNALDLLKESHVVTTKSYEGIGELVTSINGISPDAKHFWALYVNGQQSQVGAGAYVTADTDAIVWKLEEVR